MNSSIKSKYLITNAAPGCFKLVLLDPGLLRFFRVPRREDLTTPPRILEVARPAGSGTA
jgi:hypothetical protein